jgi:hypothetical protein
MVAAALVAKVAAALLPLGRLELSLLSRSVALTSREERCDN